MHHGRRCTSTFDCRLRTLTRTSTSLPGRVKQARYSLGPAIIIATVVLGPGTILTNSKVGCEFGYSMLWLLVSAVVLMIGMTALSGYLGAIGDRTLCGEVAHRLGRSVAAGVGILVFLIVACFQGTNNAAVLASVEGLSGGGQVGTAAQIAILAVLNGVLLAALYGFRKLYQPLERLMVVLVASMLVAFGVNLALARPSLLGVLMGMIPTLPATSAPGGPSPKALWSVFGLVATTYSVAGAFYQSYLVREKQWTVDDTKRGLTDTIVGIAMLGVISAIIMSTAAAALNGKVEPDELSSVSVIARQLEPLFGSFATRLFSLGIFAAAFSSFLGNALVGGTILSDSLGLGSRIDDAWPRRFTGLALLVGMGMSVASMLAGSNMVDVIIFAQALTVLGVPALAAILLWLGLDARRNGSPLPTWVLVLAVAGNVASVLLAVRAAASVWGALLGK